MHIEKTTNRVCDGMNKRRAHMTLNIPYLHYTPLHENVHTACIDTHTYSVVRVCVCVWVWVYVPAQRRTEQIKHSYATQDSLFILHIIAWKRIYYIYAVCVCVCVCTYLHSSVQNIS